MTPALNPDAWRRELAALRAQADRLDWAAEAMLQKPWWRALPPALRRERDVAQRRAALAEALHAAEHRARRAQTRPAWVAFDQARVPQALWELDAALRAIARHPWWRAALLVRTCLGLCGLRARAFKMPLDGMPPFCFAGTAIPAPAIPALRYPAAPGVYHAAVAQLFPHLPPDMQEEVLDSEAGIEKLQGDMPQLLVSIIMPSWNRAAIVSEAIQSVREQTWPHWELLVCDDGSADNTAAVVEAIGDERIRVLRLPHAGAARARNAGLAEAQGDYIAYLDSDNLWHPEYLRVVVGRLAESPEHSCAIANYLDIRLGSAGSRLYRRTDVDFSYERLQKKNFIDLNTFCHQKRLYEELGGFTPDLPRWQDWDLALRYTKDRPPVTVDLYLALYRRNKDWGQITSTMQSAAREQDNAPRPGGP